MRQKRRLKVFEYRGLRGIFVSKKDDVTRKWTKYIMRKIEEMSEYNVYNTVKTKTKTHLKCTNTQALTLKKNNNFLLGKINTKHFKTNALYPEKHRIFFLFLYFFRGIMILLVLPQPPQ